MIRFESTHLQSALLKLAERARRAEWRPAEAFNWQRGTSLSAERQELAWRIASQGSYAEQVGMLTAARLLNETEDLPARLCLATAVNDEAKHSEVFARYAFCRGGSVEPAAEHVQALYRGLQEIDDFLGRFYVHTALEWFAADEFTLLARAFQGDVLGDIYLQVRSDEMRHVGLGMLYMEWRLRDPACAGWDAARYERLALELAGIGEDFFEWIAPLARTSPDAVRRWVMGRHQARMRRLMRAAGASDSHARSSAS